MPRQLDLTKRDKNLMSKPIDEARSDSTTAFLLRILTNEIARDGGACYVTTLKDYIIGDGITPREHLRVPSSTSSSLVLPTSLEGTECCNKSKKRRNQQLNSLLIHSNIGKPRLLAFLEAHPNIFRVDRGVVPHWVQLVKNQNFQAKSLSDKSNSAIRNAETIEKTTHDKLFIARKSTCENLQTKLFQKVFYVLRKRQARIDRRKKRNSDNEFSTAELNNGTSDVNDMSDIGVYCHWLLRQCSWELHFLLRQCDFYQDPALSGYVTPSDVKQVWSKEWEVVTLPIFERLLVNGKEYTSSNISGSQQALISWIHVRAGKAILRHSASEEEYRSQSGINNNEYSSKIDSVIRSLFPFDEGKRGMLCDENKMGVQKNTDRFVADNKLSLVRRIDQTLTEIVCRRDGGHQISLQLLLHRYPKFRDLLGGRDLWALYCDFSDFKQDDSKRYVEKNADVCANNAEGGIFFQSISMFYIGVNLILRSKISKSNESDNDNDGFISKNSTRERRMKVDEEGLYSVTNNKWGRAMSNLVTQACCQKNLFEQELAGTQAKDDRNENEKNKEVTGTKSSSLSVPRLVIDLTASVGGMTLALARSNFFDRVLALEIDEGRAKLCRENLIRHGFHVGNNSTSDCQSSVEIQNQDSVKQIPLLPRRVCFVIDPPWYVCFLR